MFDFLIKVAINAIALFVADQVVAEFLVELEPVRFVAVALIFGLVNTFIRPIVQLLALPITLLTLGFFALVINAALLLFVAWVSDQLGLTFTLAGWPDAGITPNMAITAFLASLVISIVSTALGLVRKVI